MKYVAIMVSIIMAFNFVPFNFTSTPAKNADNWLLHARISSPYIYDLPWEEAIDRVIKNGANVIIDWAGFSDTYQGRILNFTRWLDEFKQRVAYVHSHYPGIKYMVYFAPFEMQTVNSDMNMDGKDDDGKGSTYTDHPDWLQVGIDGRKAVFYGSMPGMPFWVEPTSEDVWLSPSNEEYKAIIMNEARSIAAAGADAIWFDVPHLCFDFGDAWQAQWSTVDNASLAAFYNDTGLVLPPPPIHPDWNNRTWLEFVAWRYKQVIDYVRDFYNAMKEGNPDCKLVIETSSESVSITQHGCDITMLPHVCDVIAHEYGGPFERVQYYSWLEMLAIMKQWRDFDFAAGKNATWLLSYVKQGDVELASFHAAILAEMGFNYYTSGNEGMSGMVDEQFMHDLFEWLKEYDSYIYGWKSNASIAVVFSRNTLDYMDRGSWEGYAYHDTFHGIMMMLIEANIPFEVIDSRMLNSIQKYKLIILPDFACMSDEEAEKIRDYVKNGGTIIAINDTSLYDEYGRKRSNYLLADVFGVDWQNAEDKIYINSYGGGKSIFTPTPIACYYYWAASPWSNHAHKKEAEYWRSRFMEMINMSGVKMLFDVKGNVIAMKYEKGDKKMIRILNFNGIKYGNASPAPQNIEIKIKGRVKDAKIIDFIGGIEDAKVEERGNYSIASFILHEAAILVYSMNETELYVSIEKPERGKLYIMDRQIMNFPETFIIGAITIEVSTNGEKVDFYIDGIKKAVLENHPYKWRWNEFVMGRHEIMVKSYLMERQKTDSIQVTIFNLGAS